MVIEILSKLLSESLLSLYPVFVKYIGIPLHLQLWSRFFTYSIISILFVNYSYLVENLFSTTGLLLSIVTLIHVYTSYRGFQLLESGISYTIFYLYPIMLLLMAGKTVHPIMLLSLVGVYLLATSSIDTKSKSTKESMESGSPTKIEEHTKDHKKVANTTEGVFMITLAAFTEAIIYFIVRNLKTKNNWNHVFISYFLGAVLFSVFFLEEIKQISVNSMLSLSLVGNLVIGLLGYYLRFFAISRLDSSIYAPLSYFGIVMAYFYGILFNHDTLTIHKILGTLCIVLPNIYLSIYT
jgi:drug/metabolite transporter (DMT)-like permease